MGQGRNCVDTTSSLGGTLVLCSNAPEGRGRSRQTSAATQSPFISLYSHNLSNGPLRARKAPEDVTRRGPFAPRAAVVTQGAESCAAS